MPRFAIALLSGTALAYEILLTRLLANVQWHHFAAMVISLALLGYGASGTLLSLIGRPGTRRFQWAFVSAILGFALTAPAAFLAAQRLPFNPLELAWDARQLLYLGGLYSLLSVPFLAAASAIGLAFWHWRELMHRVYAWDLAGASAGALGVIWLLDCCDLDSALVVIGLLGLLTALVASWELGLTKLRRLVLAIAATTTLLYLLLPDGWRTLQPSPYKDLVQNLQGVGAEIRSHRYGALGRIDVIDNRQVPFRFAPGLSLASSAGPPQQQAVFLDGNLLGAITRLEGDPRALGYLDQLSSALPYALAEPRSALILAAGTGGAVLQALQHGVPAIDAVELNPQLLELMQGELASFTGDLYRRPEVRLQQAESRHFVATHPGPWDLIQLDLAASPFAAAASGLGASQEDYLHTREAIAGYLERLRPDGTLAITSWTSLPPRATLRLAATAIAALRSSGDAAPERQLAVIRSWKTATLLVRPGGFSETDIAALRRFCQSRSFDPVYFPGIRPDEVNRFHRLAEPVFHQGVLALLGPDSEQFLRDYRFDVAPVGDDRPFFNSFSKWSALPELLRLPAGSGLGQIDWGYWVLLATLAQAVLLSLLLILLPLWLLRRRGTVRASVRLRWRSLIYFAALGLAFMFVEIAYLQKLELFLGHPLLSLSLVLGGFLLFAGLGSMLSNRFDSRFGPWLAAGGASVLVVIELLLLPLFTQSLLLAPDPVRILAALALIAPLGLLMGMPLPLGLALTERLAPGLLPWAWAINGCGSVIGAVLARLLAMEIGFSGVMLLAALLYLLAAFSLRGLSGRPATAAA